MEQLVGILEILLVWKDKIKVHINDGPEFGSNLFVKNSI
jgi:hypothetical protein